MLLNNSCFKILTNYIQNNKGQTVIVYNAEAHTPQVGQIRFIRHHK